MATLTLTDGPADLVTFPEMVEFEEGSRVAVVEMTTGAEAGEAEIETLFPDENGGDSADLKVKIREDRRGPPPDDEGSPDDVGPPDDAAPP